MNLIAETAKAQMGTAVARWIEQCEHVDIGGRTPRDRVWACFQDWLIEQEQGRRGRNTAAGAVQPRGNRLSAPVGELPPREPRLFHLVMASKDFGTAESASYRVTIARSCEPKEMKEPKKPWEKKATRPVKTKPVARKQ